MAVCVSPGVTKTYVFEAAGDPMVCDFVVYSRAELDADLTVTDLFAIPATADLTAAFTLSFMIVAASGLAGYLARTLLDMFNTD